MELFDKLYKRHKVKNEKRNLKWAKKFFFYDASAEVVDRTYRNRFLGNWFNDQQEINDFKNNLYKFLIRKPKEDRRFGIKGETGYDKTLDSSIIEKSTLFRDGILLGYEKCYETERERIYEEFEKKNSPERLKQDKREFIRGLVFNCMLFGILSFSSVQMIHSYKNQKVLNEQRNQIKEFYQKNGVCPNDSTSQDFVEWQKLWDEKFGKNN